LLNVKRGWSINLRSAAGMHLSHECRFYFWVGWIAWVLAVWAALFGEYVWRVPDPPAFYLVEAGGAMLSWLIALALADWQVVTIYQATWHLLQHRTLAPVALNAEVVERIRNELATDPLLRWFRPPKTSGIRAQLMTVALWFQAVAAPEGSPRWRRYSEWLIDGAFGYLPIVAACVVIAVWPKWRGMGTAALLGAIGMAVLGYSLIRLAARRQAILDFFTTEL
jgi:hypothetical protein